MSDKTYIDELREKYEGTWFVRKLWRDGMPMFTNPNWRAELPDELKYEIDTKVLDWHLQPKRGDVFVYFSSLMCVLQDLADFALHEPTPGDEAEKILKERSNKVVLEALSMRPHNIIIPFHLNGIQEVLTVLDGSFFTSLIKLVDECIAAFLWRKMDKYSSSAHGLVSSAAGLVKNHDEIILIKENFTAWLEWQYYIKLQGDEARKEIPF